MQIALIYNEHAGEGMSRDELTEQVERGGHEVVATLGSHSDLTRVLKTPAELVVAAGGDGTIASAAKAVAGSGRPLAVLPLGTANNIAKSLGIHGALPELIECWRHAVPVPVDLGCIGGADSEGFFVEGVGVGLIAEGIASALRQNAEPHPDTAAQVEDDVRHYREALARITPQRLRLSADGHEMSGQYLMVEILNMPSVGPNIVVASDVSPFDGRLSVVTASEEHRHALLEYLEARRAGQPADLSLPCRSARTVELSEATLLHVDDEIQPAKATTRFSFRIEQAAVQLLTAQHVADR